MDDFAKEREEQAALILAAKRQAASRKYNPLKRGPLVPKNASEPLKKARIEEPEIQVNKVESETGKENSFAEERAQMAAMILAAKKNSKKGKNNGMKMDLDVNLAANKCELEEKKDVTRVETANVDMNVESVKKDDMSIDQEPAKVKENKNTVISDVKKIVCEKMVLDEGDIAKRRDQIRYGFTARPIKLQLSKQFPQSDIKIRLIEKGKSLVERKLEMLENMVCEEEEDLDLEVPDTEFHDFDSDRTWRDFQKDQVWAAYDDDDGMPRFYALVQKILSQKRLKIRISYLKGRSTAEFGRMSWIGSGFSKTCGDFRVDTKPEIIRSENMFSHRVHFEKTPKGVISILPQKGEIWALYKNWSSNWDAQTDDEIIHKYEFVQILEEYEKKKGIWVVDLVKLSGFRTVFKRVEKELGLDRRFVKREEMLRLSHKVPAFALDGIQSKDGGESLDGCFELDPASLPVDLVRIKNEGLEGKI